MVLLVVTAGFAPQQDNFTKNFKLFKEIVPGIDFFAASRSDVVPFEKPVKEAQAKLATFFGKDLPRGVLAICSTLEQKDSISERRLLKMGYRWALILLTPEATSQRMLAQIKAQMGGQLPPALMQLIQSPPPELKAAGTSQLVASSIQKIGNAILMTSLSPEMEFRSSRVDDVGRSPLADWLDIGIVSYAAGSAKSTLKFLQDHLEEGFPLEDILSMSRPFVAPADDGSPAGGGSAVRIVTAGGSGSGAPAPTPPAGGAGGIRIAASGGPGGQPQGMPFSMTMPKDVQDRLLFDAEASSFFSYIIEKLGVEKCRAVVLANREKKDTREILLQKDMFGSEIETLEKDWQTWVKAQKPEVPAMMKFMTPEVKPGPKP
jgi:hypothetical protein